ncbi:MAG TPA: T9SS type A sorting domain-containing protein, partial [Bacteroidia bacterium]|nr:T9SS type A sorting domain-containing protein [Bacteroidia bacterium]
NDGGYYVACSITDTITYITQWNVFSIDATGNLLWSNAYNADAFMMEVTTMDTCGNGDVILAGTYYDLTQQKYMMVITRVNPNGSMVWTKKYVSAGIYDFYPREITHVGNNIVLAAIAYNSVAVTSSTVILKMDSAGNVSWSKIYSHITHQIDPFDIVPVENNNFAITGTANNPNIASFFLKVDASGQVIGGRVYANWNIHTVQHVNAWQYSISGSYKDSMYPQAAYMVTDINGMGCADGGLGISDGSISFTVTNGSGFQSFPFAIGTGTTPSPVATYLGDDICRITGIPSTEQETIVVNVFPSPATDLIQVTSTDIISHLELIDVNGKVVRVANPGAPSYNLDVTMLPAAIYYLKITCDDQILFRKILIAQ